MKKKIVLGVLLAAGLILFILLAKILWVFVLVYVALFGNPITENNVAKEILVHLEEKYDEKFVLVDKTFHFGTYGGLYSPEKNKDIQFEALKIEDAQYDDFYPKETWLYQIEEELIPKSKDIIVDYAKIEATADGDIEEDETVEGKIPNYKDISNDNTLRISIEIDALYADINKEEMENRIYYLTQYLKEETDTVGLYVFFETPEAGSDKEDGYYNIGVRDLEDIASISDVKKYLVGS